jgi:2-phosphosulfolactate phosphatase
VVFDVLRSTTTMLTALANGAEAIEPVAEIPEALAIRERNPAVLLGGERNGLRIGAELTGGIEFDLGNSPREFTRERVAGRTIVMTTTNGTRALRACAGASAVLPVNRQALARHLLHLAPDRLVLVCAGTHDEMAYEDVLGAGALLVRLAQDSRFAATDWSDSARIAAQIFEAAPADLSEAVRWSRNGRRLLALPELAQDVGLCFTLDSLALVAGMGADGCLRQIRG